MPCATSCAAASPGACSRTTFLPTAPSGGITAAGVRMAVGCASTTPCASRCAPPPGRNPPPVPGSWTAKASRPRKKGAQRLRCRQAGERPQAHADRRYPRYAPRPVGASGRYSGLRRRERGLGDARGGLSPARKGLGGWPVWEERLAGVGKRKRGGGLGDRKAAGRRERVRDPSKAL